MRLIQEVFYIDIDSDVKLISLHFTYSIAMFRHLIKDYLYLGLACLQRKRTRLPGLGPVSLRSSYLGHLHLNLLLVVALYKEVPWR